MTRYVPAAFDPYEFDDGRDTASSDRASRRWFSGFNGLIGEPPQNVTLAYSDGVRTVLVRTDNHPPWDTADARENAAHVALGGTSLLPQRRPVDPTEIFAKISRIAVADDLWVRTPRKLDGGSDAEMVVWGNFALWHFQIDDSAVFVAATNLNDREFKVRKVWDWASYDVDGGSGFPLNSLRGSP